MSDTPLSAAARLWPVLLRLARRPRRFSSAAVVQERVQAHRRASPAPPRALTRRLEVHEEQRHGWRCFTVVPPDATALHVLFLHGGAHVNEIGGFHWRFVRRLAEQSRARIVVPIYPLAPEHTYREVYPVLMRIYADLVEDVGAANLVVMGDSAGGSMALVVAQTALADGLPQPASLVLLCPGLEITLSNPEAAAIEPRDPMLAVAGVRECGRMWLGDGDPTDPQASPLLGPVDGLAPTTLYVGDRDVLVADCRALRDRWPALRYVERPGLVHDYLLLPSPEARADLADIVAHLPAPGGR